MARANVQLRIAEVINVRTGLTKPDAEGRTAKVRRVDLALEGGSVQVDLDASIETLPLGASGIGYFKGRVQPLKRQFGKNLYDVTAVSLESMYKFDVDKEASMPAFPNADPSSPAPSAPLPKANGTK